MVKRDTIETICRGVLKTGCCVYCLWHIIEICTRKGNIISEALFPLGMFIFSLILSALFTVLVHKWIKINPPSLVLFGMEIVAAVLGLLVGKWIGKALMIVAVGALAGCVLLFAGSIFLLVGLRADAEEKETESLFHKAQTQSLTPSEQDRFLYNVNHGSVPYEYKNSIEFERIVREQREEQDRR